MQINFIHIPSLSEISFYSHITKEMNVFLSVDKNVIPPTFYFYIPILTNKNCLHNKTVKILLSTKEKISNAQNVDFRNMKNLSVENI